MSLCALVRGFQTFVLGTSDTRHCAIVLFLFFFLNDSRFSAWIGNIWLDRQINRWLHSSVISISLHLPSNSNDIQ